MKHGSVKVVTCVKYSLSLLPELRYGARVFQAKPIQVIAIYPSYSLLCIAGSPFPSTFYSSNISVLCPGVTTPHPRALCISLKWLLLDGWVFTHRYRDTHMPRAEAPQAAEAENSAQTMSSINTVCSPPTQSRNPLNTEC